MDGFFYKSWLCMSSKDLRHILPSLFLWIIIRVIQPSLSYFQCFISLLVWHLSYELLKPSLCYRRYPSLTIFFTSKHTPTPYKIETLNFSWTKELHIFPNFNLLGPYYTNMANDINFPMSLLFEEDKHKLPFYNSLCNRPNICSIASRLCK